MTPDDARTLVLRLLGDIAPDADLDALGPDDDIPSTLDLDSMDRLNLVEAASAELGRDIPDQDARRLLTLDAWVDYVAA